MLEERVTFLTGPPLPRSRKTAISSHNAAQATASVYEHCARAIERSLQVGAARPAAHGRRRLERRDESRRPSWQGRERVARLVPVRDPAAVRDDRAGARRARAGAALGWRTQRICAPRSSSKAWDGAWYRRAYFDDGTPLGTAAAAECRIDSIAQSWSVLSRAADPVRARQAMESVAEYLLRPSDDLVLLLTPPFDTPAVDPGYIRGYLPGVRENGGQYTQAAVWCAIAFCMLGEGTTAHEILNRLNPIQRAASRAGVQRLHGRALRAGRRRIFRAPAQQARRLDLVHRRGGLDVPRRDRMAAGAEQARRHASPSTRACLLTGQVPASSIATATLVT